MKLQFDVGKEVRLFISNRYETQMAGYYDAEDVSWICVHYVRRAAMCDKTLMKGCISSIAFMEGHNC